MKLLIDIPKEKYEWIKKHYLDMDNDSIVGAVANGTPYEERPQGDCEKCDFRKFSESFIDGIVDVMSKNDITSIEQLSEILKVGNE